MREKKSIKLSLIVHVRFIIKKPLTNYYDGTKTRSEWKERKKSRRRIGGEGRKLFDATW